MRAVALLLPLLLAACHDEPSFDERYDKATRDVEARAKQMDADIAETDKAAAASDETLQALPEAAKPSNAPPSSGE